MSLWRIERSSSGYILKRKVYIFLGALGGVSGKRSVARRYDDGDGSQV